MTLFLFENERHRIYLHVPSDDKTSDFPIKRYLDSLNERRKNNVRDLFFQLSANGAIARQ